MLHRDIKTVHVQELDGDLQVEVDPGAEGVTVNVKDGPFEQQLTRSSVGWHLCLRPRRSAGFVKGAVALVVPEGVPVTTDGCPINWVQPADKAAEAGKSAAPARKTLAFLSAA